jgi:hypothetical protein
MAASCNDLPFTHLPRCHQWDLGAKKPAIINEAGNIRNNRTKKSYIGE